MIKTLEILPYEICDAFQNFLLNSVEFETFLNTKGFTNNASTESLKQISYIHYPKQTLAITSFPFITFESYESRDKRREEEGFSWDIDIVIGLSDLDEDSMDKVDHENTTIDNVQKFTKTRDVQDIGKQVIATIGEEIEISGIKGNFEIEFGNIQHSTTPTGEFDSIYHGIELKLISYKEI